MPTAASLVGQVMGRAPELGAQPPVAPVDKYGNVPVAEFVPALEAATGFKTVDEIKALREQAQQFEAVRQRATELEAKVASAPKFAATFVEKLNSLVESGADPARLNAWWSLANTDLDKVDPIDLLVMQKQLQNPGMSKEMLHAYVLSEHGIDADGGVDMATLPPAKAAKLQIEANQAKTALLAEKASIETVTPANGQAHDPAIAQMREVQVQKATNFWGEFLGGLSASIPFQFEDAEKGIPKYSFDFTPRAEVVDAARKQVLAAIATDPNMFPFTAEGAAQMKATFDGIVAMASVSDMQRAMFLDVYNSVRAASVARNAATPTGAQAVPPAQGTQAKALTALMNAIKDKPST